MHEAYNFLIKHLENNQNSKDLLECYKNFNNFFTSITALNK